MKSKIWLLVLFCGLTIDTGIARGVEVKTAPAEQNTPSFSEGAARPVTVGPRDPEKVKPHGVGVNLFLSRKLAVSGSVSLLPQQYLQTGQTGNNEELGLNASQMGGAVGLKVFFN